MKLQGKVSVITGAGSGIGRAMSQTFAREGSKIVVVDMDETGGRQTVDAVKTAGGQAVFARADVTDSAQVQAAVRSAVTAFGGINILCNNAGVSWPAKDRLVTEMAEEDWDRIVDIDLKSVFLCSKYVIPEIIKAGGGAIVNTSSISGLIISERPAYAASKGGMIALTRSLAAQYANNKIRVNAVCPGLVDTPLQAGALKDFSVAAPQFPFPKPLIKRLATPQEIANMALFLVSDDASFCTAGAYMVDGGISAR